MTRLVLPLLVLTILLWIGLYAAPKSPRNKTLFIVRQILIALTIAGGVLCIISGLFLLGDLIK